MELCGTTINFFVWGTHLPKIDKHAKNVLVFYILRIYAGKNRKTKNVGTWGPGAPTFLRFSFFEIFFSKFVKREKLAHFWHGCLRLEKWNRILGIICLLISTLTRIKLYYQKASVRTDAGQMPDRCSFFNTV